MFYDTGKKGKKDAADIIVWESAGCMSFKTSANTKLCAQHEDF